MRSRQILRVVGIWLVFTTGMLTAQNLTVSTVAPSIDGAVGGVAVDRLGYIYVADFRDNVWRISPWGDTEVFADGLYGASGNTVSADGRLFQSSFHGNKLYEISRTGEKKVIARDLGGPVGVVEGKNGDLFVCNCRSNEISRIDGEGQVSTFSKGKLFNCPNGITQDGEGRLFVVNFSDTSVIEIDSDGRAKLLTNTPGFGNGHIVWAGGDLFITNFRGNQVIQVGLDGSSSVVAGTGAFGEQDGPGLEATFSSPNGIAWDATRRTLYVNDFLVPFPKRQTDRPVSSLRALTFPSITQILNQSFSEGGVAAMETAYREFKEKWPGQFTQIQMNVFGYTLLQGGQMNEALRVFELNVEAYPKAANPWDSLAEAHMRLGNKEKAIEFYQKSLELNPSNTNATQMLLQLENQ